MIRINSKIHPSSIITSEEFQANVEEAAVQLRDEPYRAKSLRNSTLPQYRNGSLASFLSQGSISPPQYSVENLIDYLTTFIDMILIDKDHMHKFEELSAEVISYAHNFELHRIVKSHGWTGSRYRGTEDTPFEAHSLLQALSNLYLKNKVSNYTAHISNMFELGDEKSADQILSFCPDLLLTCLRDKSFPHGDFGVQSFSFTGACMLADISGFSKFSGAMCLEGVSGLDDLREATNGFLGQLVKTVYEFRGDGELLGLVGVASPCSFLHCFLASYIF
jgi:hypothetical protein